MALQARIVDEQEALAGLIPEAVKEALRKAFAGLNTAASVQPAQTVTEFPDGEGDCIFYPGLLWDLDLVGVKVSPYISALGKQGKSLVTAYTLLLSASTGQPKLLCDSLALTTARTAATTALALDYLAPSSARRLAVIGAGKVAQEHLRYVAPARSWASISAFSPSLADGRKQFDDFDVRVAGSAREAVSDADVVMLCTSSARPVLDLADVKAGAIITSISTNGFRAHEIEPAALAEVDVFCDYRVTAPVTAGEMILAEEGGLWLREAIVADLPEVVRDGRPADSSRRRYFRSTGLGIEDLAIASLLC